MYRTILCAAAAGAVIFAMPAKADETLKFRYSSAQFSDEKRARMSYTNRSNVTREAGDTGVPSGRAPGRADRRKRIMKAASVAPFSRAASITSAADIMRRCENVRDREQPA